MSWWDAAEGGDLGAELRGSVIVQLRLIEGHICKEEDGVPLEEYALVHRLVRCLPLHLCSAYRM